MTMLLRTSATTAALRPPLRRLRLQQRRECSERTDVQPTGLETAAAWEREYLETRRNWEWKHKAKHPFYQVHGFRIEKDLPRPRDGQHVVDLAGLLSETPEAVAKINDTCRLTQAATGVNVVFLLLGDIGSHTTGGLARLLGNHYTQSDKESGKDPAENTILVVVSRKNGTLDTYVGWGCVHVFHPLWIRSQFNKTFKVYFKGREWDTKLLEYAEALRSRAEAKRGSIGRTGSRAWVNANMPFLAAGALLLLLLLHDAVVYVLFWRERQCPTHGVSMVASTDDRSLEEVLSPVELVEHRHDCVEFDLWKCPEKDCTSRHYSERVWNDLRTDCLRCKKCGGRCSVGTRAVVNAADSSSRGEVVNSRACRYCGFQEAWTSLLSASASGGDGVSRGTAGNYGSETYLRYSNSLIGRFVLGTKHADSELQQGVGRIGDKTTGANTLRPTGFFFSP